MFDRAGFDAGLQRRWTRMKDALRQGDVGRALDAVAAPARDRYRDLLTALTLPLSDIDRVLTDIGNPDGYERWVDHVEPDELALFIGRPAIRPSPDIFRRAPTLPPTSRTDHPAAPAPVKRLIDTGRYVGSNPEVLVGDLIGLAEYANGNFFSDDTIFAERSAVFGTIPFPARRSVELGPPEPSPRGRGRLRRYFVKARHWDTQTVDASGAIRNYRLAVPSALYEYLPDALQDQTAGLDPKVLEDYATLLLPRAVGYSAALLDHFFRGELGVRPVGASQGASTLQPLVRVTNRTEGERLDGTLSLYYDTVEGTRERLEGWQPEISLATDGESDLPPIPAPSSDKPAARPGRYLLVFQGRMGRGAGRPARAVDRCLGRLRRDSFPEHVVLSPAVESALLQ